MGYYSSDRERRIRIIKDLFKDQNPEPAYKVLVHLNEIRVYFKGIGVLVLRDADFVDWDDWIFHVKEDTKEARRRRDERRLSRVKGQLMEANPDAGHPRHSERYRW